MLLLLACVCYCAVLLVVTAGLMHSQPYVNRSGDFLHARQWVLQQQFAVTRLEH
uniref:Uncharacterized protein n=1 Tax=Aegilops tauschii subsp. strangulata TaxID=200361 RepID=A0A453CTP6_AEGTS